LKRNLLFTILLLTFIGCGEENKTSSTETNLVDNSTSEENRDITVSQKRATGALVPTEEMLSSIPEAIPVSSYSSDELPSFFDLSDKMPPVRSQGNQGSCASWAVGYYLKGYHEHIDKKTDYGIENNYKGAYSPAFLYNTVKVGDCNSGSYIYKNLDRVQNVGVATWEDMPYSDKDCTKKPSSTATKNSKCARILEYTKIRIHQPLESIEIQDIKYYLSHGNPIVIGIYVYDGFNNPKRVDGEFIYKDYEERGTRGGHAIVVVGYDDNRNAFKIINSWGTDWGNDGFLWIDYDVFSRIVFEAYRTEDALDECEEASSYISLNKQSLIFNTKLINHSYKKSFRISNSGSVSLEVNDINTPNGYSVDWKHGTIKAGEYKNVTVTFKPTEEKVYNGTLIIESDADKGKNSLDLRGEGIDETSTNLPPIANAGENITVKLGESVTLDGSKSSDDGKIVSYEWRLGDIVLSDSKKFTKDDFSEGTHRVTLKVTDEKGLTDTDTVIITIVKENNLKPIANAGKNISAKYGDSVILDGSKSKDNDGEIVEYEWKEGDKVLSNSVKFTKKDFSEGKHTIILKVTDNKGATDTDIIIVTIAKKGNIPPVANAGEDIINKVGEPLILDASKSYDPDGNIVSYKWSYLIRSGSYSTSSGSLSSNRPIFHATLNLHVNQYILTLTVTDNDGATGTDTLTVTVVK
jgi:C1A family cysteine protease